MSTIIDYLSRGIMTLLDALSSPTPPPSPLLFQETLPFGPNEWSQFLNLDIQAPAIPTALLQTLAMPCPFWPNKKVKDTHVACLIPANVTLHQLYELAADRPTYLYKDSPVQIPSKPYWILITKYPIPATLQQGFETQTAILKDAGYEVPTVVEAAIAVVAVQKLSKACIYPTPYYSTRCSDNVKGTQMTVGGDANVPFSILLDYSFTEVGMGGVRRFSAE